MSTNDPFNPWEDAGNPWDSADASQTGEGSTQSFDTPDGEGTKRDDSQDKSDGQNTVWEKLDKDHNQEPGKDTTADGDDSEQDKSKSKTLPYVLGVIGIVIAGALGFVLGGQSTKDDVSNLEQENSNLADEQSELQSQIDQLSEENSSAKSESFEYKQALNWINVCGADQDLLEGASVVAVSWRDFGIGCKYELDAGQALITLGGKLDEDETGPFTKGDQHGYLVSTPNSNEYILLNVWVSDSGPWENSEEYATELSQKLLDGAKAAQQQSEEG